MKWLLSITLKHLVPFYTQTHVWKQQFPRSPQRHSAYPNLPRVTSSHIWMLRPSPPPSAGPKFPARATVYCKCATSRLEITALQYSSRSAAEFEGKPRTKPDARRELFYAKMKGGLIWTWPDPAPSPQCSDYLFRTMLLYSSLHIG